MVRKMSSHRPLPAGRLGLDLAHDNNLYAAMKDTVHCYCPSCGRDTPHAVYQERLLAAVHWCRQCFQVTVRPEDVPVSRSTPPRADAA